MNVQINYTNIDLHIAYNISFHEIPFPLISVTPTNRKRERTLFEQIYPKC